MSGVGAAALYDHVGGDYRRHRLPDPRIAAEILSAVGRAQAVINVGAGYGSYEPRDRRVVAIEPSQRMIGERGSGAALVVRAEAENLPFADRSFDASLAILTVHHWRDRPRGLAELARVTRQKIVILTWDPEAAAEFWLVRDYFPGLLEFDRKNFPPRSEFERTFGAIESHPILIPHDCSDGFLGAYWRRPENYLDEGRRRAISSFARIDDVSRGLTALRRDIDDGTWASRNRSILGQDVLDLGYRLIVAEAFAH